MRAVILGAGGQLAHDLVLAMDGWDLLALRHADLDICDHDRVRDTLRELRPEVVINTAAMHKVELCEADAEGAFRVNAFAVRNLALVCAELDCKLVHMSTDYVFGGEKRTPYREDDAPNPLSVYGISKLAGEYFVRNYAPKRLVVRSSGLFGVVGPSGKGSNFVDSMVRLAKEGRPIRVVSDQVFSPTYTVDLAGKMKELVEADLSGVVHVTNQGWCSWFHMAQQIFEILGLTPDVSPITSADYGVKVRRPSFSVLANTHLERMNLTVLPAWQEALRTYLNEKEHLQEQRAP